MISYSKAKHTHIHTTILRPSWIVWDYSGKPAPGRYNLDLLEQEIVSGNGISWAMQICTVTHTYNYASIPPVNFFTGQMPFLPPNQQRQGYATFL